MEMTVRALRFYKVSPGGNPTILVLDPVSHLERPKVANILMNRNHLQAEQVGFLNLAVRPVRLDMMGGEFCGNACRATAAVMAREGVGLKPVEGSLVGRLSVSGADHDIEVRVDPEGGVCWTEMPLSEMLLDGSAVRLLEPGIGLVSLPGITHLLLDEAMHPFPADYTTSSARLRKRFDLDAEAVGCIWYHFAPICAIKPVVWVRATDSTHHETGCGSGSLALSLFLGRGQNFPMMRRVLQPSGHQMGVCIDSGDPAPRAWIYGQVDVIARGETFLIS